MMPPHVTSISPADGESLSGPDIVVRGYSLSHAAPPSFFDETAGELVMITWDMESNLEGPVDDPDAPPGAIQERSTVRISVGTLEPGHLYRLDYAGAVARYEARKTLL